MLREVRWLLAYWIVLFALLRYPFHNYQVYLDEASHHEALFGSPLFVGLLYAMLNLAAAPLSRRVPALVRRHGYARDNEELELGVRCIAAGIYDDTGKLVAGLSISAPAERMQDEWIAHLVKTAGEISEALGYEPAG